MNRAVIRFYILAVVVSLLSLSCSRNAFEGKVIAVEYPGNTIESAEGLSLIHI